MKNILIPTDFSPSSYQTIEHIIKLFKNEICDFYFLNTYSYRTNSLNALELLQAGDEWFDEPREESQKQLGKLVATFTVNSHGLNHGFHAISECSNLVECIKEKVELLDIDLVVLSGSIKKEAVKTNESILENVRSCPVLLVPPRSSISEKIHLTIASDFRQSINTDEIEKFCEALDHTDLEASILVLDDEHTLSGEAAGNLRLLMEYLKKLQKKPVLVQYAKSPPQLKAYALSHQDEIMCVVDKKPGFFRKLGLFKSSIMAIFKQVKNSTLLAIHDK